MSKEMWCNLYDKMVEEYCEEHPEEDERIVHETFWETHAEEIHTRYADTMGDLIDAAKQRAKAEGNWPPKKRTSAWPSL